MDDYLGRCLVRNYGDVAAENVRLTGDLCLWDNHFNPGSERKPVRITHIDVDLGSVDQSLIVNMTRLLRQVGFLGDPQRVYETEGPITSGNGQWLLKHLDPEVAASVRGNVTKDYTCLVATIEGSLTFSNGSAKWTHEFEPAEILLSPPEAGGPSVEFLVKAQVELDPDRSVQTYEVDTPYTFAPNEAGRVGIQLGARRSLSAQVQPVLKFVGGNEVHPRPVYVELFRPRFITPNEILDTVTP